MLTDQIGVQADVLCCAVHACGAFGIMHMQGLGSSRGRGEKASMKMGPAVNVLPGRGEGGRVKREG